MSKGSSIAVRPAYYDRNAATQTGEYSGFLAPHGFTQRFTYTVPSGRKGRLEYAYVYIQRTAVPSSANLYLAHLQCISGGIQLRVPLVENNSAVTGLGICTTFPMDVTVYAGETIAGQTVDFSTGGTVQYVMQYKATIYDA